MTRTGEREISAVSGRLKDNPQELACMQLANHRPKQVIYRMISNSSANYLLVGFQTEILLVYNNL